MLCFCPLDGPGHHSSSLFALLRFCREIEFFFFLFVERELITVWLGIVLNKKQDFVKLRVLGDGFVAFV